MKKKELEINTQYLDCIYDIDRFQSKVRRAVKRVREFRKTHPFDAIAFTGMSGSAMAYCLSYRLGIPLIAIRKKGEKSHYRSALEGCVNAKRILIVDDFIDTGSTVERIIKALPKTSKVIGVFLYSDWGGDSYVPGHKGIPVCKVR